MHWINKGEQKHSIELKRAHQPSFIQTDSKFHFFFTVDQQTCTDCIIWIEMYCETTSSKGKTRYAKVSDQPSGGWPSWKNKATQ